MSSTITRPRTFTILIGVAILVVVLVGIGNLLYPPFPLSRPLPPPNEFVKVPCPVDTSASGLNSTYKDRDSNTWYVYCGKYNDFSVHSDVTLQQEQDMQKLVVHRAFLLIQDKKYLPDAALSQTPSPDNNRATLLNDTNKLMGDIESHTYNFAINDSSAIRQQVDNLVTNSSYQTKIDSLFKDIQLMATNEARP